MNRGNPAEKNSQVMLRGVHLGHLCSICITPSSPSSLSASLLPPRFPRTAAAPPPTVLCHRVFQETCNQEMPSAAYFDDTHLCLLVWRGGDNSNFFHTGRAWNLKKVGNIFLVNKCPLVFLSHSLSLFFGGVGVIAEVCNKRCLESEAEQMPPPPASLSQSQS